MAIDISNWIPIEWAPEVLSRVNQDSAIEAFGSPHVMTTDTQRVLRSLDATVGTGATYTSDASTNDYILLDAVKFTGQFIVDSDALRDADSVVDTLRKKAGDWATSYAVAFDNACIGVTAAANGTTAPFTSIYKAVRTNGQTGESYTADDNYVNHGGAASAAYTDLDSVMRKVETGFYYSPSRALVIAHPTFKGVMRSAKDTTGQPIFIQGVAGTPDTLFGVPIQWSLGAKTANQRSTAPEGNPLLVVVGDTDALMRGDRLNDSGGNGPEALVDRARAQDSTDQDALKLRVRKAFGLSHPKAVAVLEKTA